jgi:hypothetical protein
VKTAAAIVIVGIDLSRIEGLRPVKGSHVYHPGTVKVGIDLSRIEGLRLVVLADEHVVPDPVVTDLSRTEGLMRIGVTSDE